MLVDETQRKDQGEAIAKAIRALFMKSDFQTIINSDQMLKATYIQTTKWEGLEKWFHNTERLATQTT